ncbi:MAG TPA: peptidyl-prolyl cis-trans isomerase [Labilithrix sp.]|nr:peptidyl-prolyl cis-trans isomerase [Labilithrix sp.]
MLVLVGLGSMAMHFSAAPSRAEDAGAADPDAARRARVAATVGSRKVTVGELEDQIAAIPVYQLSQFGSTKEAVARAYLERVVLRDLLLAGGAEQRGLERQLPTKQVLERALSGITLRNNRIAYASAAAIPMEDVRQYYEQNRSRFDSPERINLWRILCKTREEAVSVLETARRDSSIAKYNDLAREHSIDKATNLRGGNLGFVGPDGASNEAGVKVDPALVKAAQAVKDGELVPQPVAEGASFAVVWRRGTVPANRRTVEESSAQIRSALFRERTEAAEKKLIDDLRAKNVKEVNEGLLGVIELRPFDAGVSLARSPGSPATPAARDAAPPR